MRAFDNAGNARDEAVDVRNLNLFLSLARDNWIGLSIALAILAFLAWHLRTAHRRRKKVV